MNIEDLTRWFLILVLGLFGYLGISRQVEGPGAPPPTWPTATPGAAPMRIPLVIERAETIALESYPLQLQLRVSGYQQDGCRVPVQTVIARDGNTISVSIFRELPPDALCTQVIMSYEDTIPLGDFTGGHYTIHVNDLTLEVDL